MLSASQADHNLDAADLHAWRHCRHLADADLTVRNIIYAIVVLAKEMVMLSRIRIVPSLLPIDRQTSQQTRASELLKRIVNGSERNSDTFALGVVVQKLSRNMLVAPLKKESSKLKSLPREPEASAAKDDADVARNTGTLVKFASPTRTYGVGFSLLILF